MSAFDAPHFQNDEAAFAYLEGIRWPHGPICPHCGTIGRAYKTKRTGVYRCSEKGCRKDFTVRVGTVFEDSPIKLHKWLLAAYLICASKKGMSSHQLHRMLGVTYKTAWFMTHRLREAMKDSGGLLGGNGGAVEVDETYWGTSKPKGKTARGYEHKMKIVSLVERDGKKRTFRVASVNEKTLRPILKAQLSEKARLMTDEARVYHKVGKEFAEHGIVNHAAKEYARGDVTTNTVESSFALLKRGLVGTFHHVSEAHLQRYATEFDFRWNHRKSKDADRAAALLSQIAGKRLTYREVPA
ncbi:MAG: IS1595 family transposase [Sinimarinibacterium flocculans]|uniref:IS1595 family transposase n=1 Tax=Sinimarinibacterium flocculans TaxID=985250 RepID=UPI003C411345